MEETTRGTKRKRYEPPPQDLGVKIGGKLHHSLKEVKKAAKKAKAFETQKFIKKLKDLRKNSKSSEEIKEIELQLELLKELDHELVATTALRTKLNKLRILGENEHVQAAISKELLDAVTPATPGTGAAKVQSRILSSKILAAEIAAVVNDLKNVVQPPPPVASELVEEDVPTPQKQTKAKKTKETVSKKTALLSSLSTENLEEGEQDPENDADVDDAGWESGTVDEDGAGGEDGWESGSISEDDDDAGDSAEESDDDDEELKVPPPKKTKTVPVPTKTAAKPTGMQSTFLPTLSVGFTRGESDDSDLSEAEIKVADIDIKKNRRGQRARRAIWEKKFGRNANHKKKEAENTGPDRFGQDSERNTRRPLNHHSKTLAGRPAAFKTVPQYRQEADTGWGQRVTTAHSSALQRPAAVARTAVKGRMEEKPIHPSWEAKRRLKEKESAGIVPSQGKKIKF